MWGLGGLVNGDIHISHLILSKILTYLFYFGIYEIISVSTKTCSDHAHLVSQSGVCLHKI